MEASSRALDIDAPPKRRWLRRIIPVALVVMAAGLVAAVALMPTPVPPQVAVTVPPVNVRVQVIEAIPELRDTFTLTAVVEPNRIVDVAAEVPAKIECIAERQTAASWRGKDFPAGQVLAEGEPVSAGAPIVRLDDSLLAAAYERALAQFQFDDREYRRHLDMLERDAASQTEVEDARTRRDISKTIVDETKERLDRTTVNAPISGVLNALTMEIGEYAKAGDVVARIVELDPAVVVVRVPERDVHYLDLGESAEVLMQADEQRVLSGTIRYISELADENTRTTKVEIAVANADYALRSGQIVRARLTRRVLNDVIMIPLSSVIPLEEGRVVYVATADDRAERREVELDFLKGRSVRILSGLEPGDRLIVAGHRYVGPGQPVNVVATE